MRSNEPIPVTLQGKAYSSISAAIRELNPGISKQTVHIRINHLGWSVEDAILKPALTGAQKAKHLSAAKSRPVTTSDGRVFPNMIEMSKATGVKLSTAYERRRRGQFPDVAGKIGRPAKQGNEA